MQFSPAGIPGGVFFVHQVWRASAICLTEVQEQISKKKDIYL
jgi:hypothetical protein